MQPVEISSVPNQQKQDATLHVPSSPTLSPQELQRNESLLIELKFQQERGYSKPGMPLTHLCERIRARFSFSEGVDAVPNLIRTVGEYRNSGHERVSDEMLIKRVDLVIERAQKILDQVPCVHGVVYFGSGLRGKVAPNDHDIAVVTAHEDAYEAAWTRQIPRAIGSPLEIIAQITKLHGLLDRWMPNDYMVVNKALRRADLSAPIEGVRAALTAYCSWDAQGNPLSEYTEFDRMRPALSFLVIAGPMLIIARSDVPGKVSLLYTNGDPTFEGMSRRSIFGNKTGIVHV